VRIKKAQPKGGKIIFNSRLLKKATKHVEYLQKRLFQAILEGKLRIQIKFGWLLKNSFHNKVLALWKVAHVNTGKKTAGIDGMKIKLSDQRSISKIMDQLTGDLRDGKWQPLPARRVMIPKPDGTERPLGIPTQYDRVVQYVLNSILDVTVEHQIFSHKCGSYGFRKYHSSADAISKLNIFARQGKHAIAIEADISKCFDQINHQYIMELIKDIPAIRNEVKRLLKAGYIYNECQHETTEGTPQGGVISPTLSNLVWRSILDIPMANTLKRHFGKNITNITLTTDADDLVIIISPNNADNINLNQWQSEVSQNVLNWLKPQLSIAGLELKESKTRVITDDTPFDFLGYEIQRGKGTRLKDGMVKKLRNSIKSKLRRGRGQRWVLKEINPILRGVYNYAAKYSSEKMWKQLGKVDFDISKRLHKLYKTYDIGQVKYKDVPKTIKYIPVKKGMTWLVNKEYWDKRNLKMLSPRKKTLYKKQKGICPHCQRKFTLKADEILETHHLKAKGEGGKNTNQNADLYHAPCHKEIHQQEKISEFERLTNLKWRAYDGITTPP
jgi:RNA-directed DNA polymerase